MLGRAIIAFAIVNANALAANANVNAAFWVGPPVGNWGNASNWLLPTVPNNNASTQFAVLVDLLAEQSSTVIVDLPIIVNSLTVQPGDTVRVKDGRSLTLTSGALKNHGTCAVDGEEDFTELLLAATPTLTGPGTLVLEGTGFARVRPLFPTVPLLNDVQHTVRGLGTLAVADTGFLNAGAVIADIGVGASGELLIALGASAPAVNAGSMRSLLGSMRIAGGMFVNTGLLEVGDERTMQCDGAWLHAGGVMRVNGVVLPSFAIAAVGGAIEGRGLIAGPILCGAVVIDPGGNDIGDTIATLSIETLTCDANTHVRIELDGDDHDAVHVLGDATFAGGTIEIVVRGPLPMPGDQHVVIAVDGDVFGTLPSVSGCLPATTELTHAGIVVRFAVVGDLDQDGVVSAADLALLFGQWGLCDQGCCAGDIDGDGVIDAIDLTSLLAGWTQES